MTKTDTYISQITSLHTNKQNGVPAPHKAVLLLAVIDLIERGVISSCDVELSETLEQQFKSIWEKYVGRSVIFSPHIGTPFFHLHSEPFWTLVPFEGGEQTTAILRKGNPYSVGTMRKNFRCAKFDNELFKLLQDSDFRAKARVALISTYLQPQKRIIDTI